MGDDNDTIDRDRKRIERIERELDEVVEKLKTSKDENDSLVKQVKKIEEEKTTAEANVSTLKETNTNIGNDNTKLTESVKTLTGEKNKLEDNVERSRIKSVAKSSLGDYTFRNKFEESGFNTGLLNKTEDKYMSDNDVKKFSTEFLKSAKPPTDDKDKDKGKDGRNDKNKGKDKGNDNSGDETPHDDKTRQGLASAIKAIMGDGTPFTQEKAVKVRKLEKELEAAIN